MRLWLTKDDMMQPRPLGASMEQGFYICFNEKTWQRERRELVLNIEELEQLPVPHVA